MEENEEVEAEEQVKRFLNSIKLGKYFDKFIENGVDDLETILELDANNIAELGIPMGHKLKILKNIKKYKTQKSVSNYCEPVSVKDKGKGRKRSSKKNMPGLFLGSYNDPVEVNKKDQLREALAKYKNE